MVLINWKNLQ